MTPASKGTRQLLNKTYAMVLAGGRGSRLKELTQTRAKPAVYFGAKQRIIDFSLSNVWNSGIRKTGVATQYKAHSLIRHLQRGWNFADAQRGEYMDILPASQRLDDAWYKGTADAVYQNLDIIDAYDPDYILILAGDHVYKMDYSHMLRQHVETGAQVTVGCIEVPMKGADQFGIMDIDADGKIIDFLEKPAKPPHMPGDPSRALASMGIYVFDYRRLKEILKADAQDGASEHDFGKNFIPMLANSGDAYAHKFSESCIRSEEEPEAYWRDVGTLDSFFEANIDLCTLAPSLDIYDQSWPIFTYSPITAPAKFVHAQEGRTGRAVGSLVAGGTIVSGGLVEHSMLFTNVRVNSFTHLRDCILFPNVDVGRGARLNRCIVEQGVKIPGDLVVGEDAQADRERFRRTDMGVTVITHDMIAALN